MPQYVSEKSSKMSVYEFKIGALYHKQLVVANYTCTFVEQSMFKYNAYLQNQSNSTSSPPGQRLTQL
jgi:hypothetical protein